MKLLLLEILHNSWGAILTPFLSLCPAITHLSHAAINELCSGWSGKKENLVSTVMRSSTSRTGWELDRHNWRLMTGCILNGACCLFFFFCIHLPIMAGTTCAIVEQFPKATTVVKRLKWLNHHCNGAGDGDGAQSQTDCVDQGGKKRKPVEFWNVRGLEGLIWLSQCPKSKSDWLNRTRRSTNPIRRRAAIIGCYFCLESCVETARCQATVQSAFAW